jgi:hypothetical protein
VSTLNAKQVDLLSLVWYANEAVVYGRAASATAEALVERGLLMQTGTQATIVMGKVEKRPRFMLTDKGALALHEHIMQVPTNLRRCFP